MVLRVARSALVVLLLASASVVFADAKVGKKAPAISGNTLSGKKVDLKKLRGKVVLVDFWATWCAPCKVALPFYAELYRKKKKDGFELLTININKKEAAARAFAKKEGFKFPIVHDSDQKIIESYNPSNMPTSYLIDKKGKIRYIHAGFNAGQKAKITKEIERLLSE